MSEIAVKGPIAVQNIVPQTKVADQDAQKVGAGSVASAGVVPDPIGQSYEAISQSLSKFFPELTGDKVDILIAEASLKLKEIIGKTETNELNAKEEQKRQNAAETRAAAEDAQKSFDEAKAAEAKAKKSGLFGKIFGGIATALSLIVGAMMIMTGVGAALGVAMIVGGVASAMMLADGIVAENNDGTGMFGLMATKIMENNGCSEEAIERVAAKWDKAFMGIMISLMIVSALVSVGTMVNGAASAGAAAGTVAAETGSKWATTISVTKSVTSVTQNVTTIAAAGAGISTAVIGYGAAKSHAEAQNQQADAARMRALNEHLNDFIDQILARISGTNSQFNAMLDDVTASIKDRGDTLARAKFAG